ncbi:MAG: hypothetical protein ACOVLE_09355, partial [Pirellula staleyi]
KTKGFCIADGTWNVPATIISQPERKATLEKRARLFAQRTDNGYHRNSCLPSVCHNKASPG